MLPDTTTKIKILHSYSCAKSRLLYSRRHNLWKTYRWHWKGLPSLQSSNDKTASTILSKCYHAFSCTFPESHFSFFFRCLYAQPFNKYSHLSQYCSRSHHHDWCSGFFSNAHSLCATIWNLWQSKRPSKRYSRSFSPGLRRSPKYIEAGNLTETSSSSIGRGSASFSSTNWRHCALATQWPTSHEKSFHILTRLFLQRFSRHFFYSCSNRSSKGLSSTRFSRQSFSFCPNGTFQTCFGTVHRKDFLLVLGPTIVFMGFTHQALLHQLPLVACMLPKKFFVPHWKVRHSHIPLMLPVFLLPRPPCLMRRKSTPSLLIWLLQSWQLCPVTISQSMLGIFPSWNQHPFCTTHIHLIFPKVLVGYSRQPLCSLLTTMMNILSLSIKIGLHRRQFVQATPGRNNCEKSPLASSQSPCTPSPQCNNGNKTIQSNGLPTLWLYYILTPWLVCCCQLSQTSTS